jgi:hypothetical protein
MAAIDPAVQAALVGHDRIQKSTDIQLFFGNTTKETVMPQQLIETGNGSHGCQLGQ